jgi:hypothetical protein
MRWMAASLLIAGLIAAVPSGSAASSDQPDREQQAERSGDQKDKADAAAAQPAGAGAQTQTQTSSSSMSVPIYKPPLRGAPDGRLGGGSRGTALGLLSTGFSPAEPPARSE